MIGHIVSTWRYASSRCRAMYLNLVDNIVYNICSHQFCL